MAAEHDAPTHQTSGKVALYANVGPDLHCYDVDVTGATLVKQGIVTMPAAVQYAWPHASQQYLYVASSDKQAPPSAQHYITALRIDPKTGALTTHGASIQLHARPIHVTTDISSDNILVAFAVPAGLRIFRIRPDCTLGAEVTQRGPINPGFYPHQIRITPDNRHAILVAKGHTPTNHDDPGALKVFDYDQGILSNEASIAPNGGKNFNPRHLDFHPSKPWIYVSLEMQNKICMYRLEKDRVESEISFQKDTLAAPGNISPRQIAGPIRVHPNGRFVYVANRADSTVDFKGRKVFAGGENNIAVYTIDSSTGEPTLIQNIDTQKIHPRTFHIDPSGRLMVVQHNLPKDVRDGENIQTVAAGLSVFRIGDDGRLTLARLYDFDIGDQTMFWMGMVSS